MAGGRLPVEPRRRFTWVFRAAEPLSRDLPLTIDPSGVHVRSDGAAVHGRLRPRSRTPRSTQSDFPEDHEIWEERAWPAIAARIPAFERVRVASHWVGHYDHNTVDQNALLGPLPECPDMLVMSGFSGHGLQHAAPCARGIAELIHHGAYRSLDLSPLGFARLHAPDHAPAARERAVI